MVQTSSKVVRTLCFSCLTLSLATLLSSRQSYGDAHDVAVTAFSASPNPVSRGATVTLSVTVKNQGTQAETGVMFRMRYNDTTFIGPIKIPTWKAGQEFSGTFNIAVPERFPTGEYLVTGELSTVSGESNTDNNAQTIKVTVQDHP